MLLLRVVLCLCLTVVATALSDNTNEEDDSIVIDAVGAEETERDGKQLQVRSPEVDFYQPLWNYPSSRASGPCFTSKGVLGKCTSYRQCYPNQKTPDIANWEGWILGMYDTCSYFTVQGRQMFGVCCVNPIKPDSSTETSTTNNPEDPDTTSAAEELDAEKFNITKQTQYPQIPNWPPPIPTHPPDHTIPPLPTHPPSPGYPGLPTAPTAKPPANWPPTSKKPGVNWPPTSKPPSWPPTSKPPGAAWPPTNKPPAAAWPPSTKPPAPAWPPSTKPTVETTTHAIPAAPVAPADASCGAKNGYQDQERIVGGHNADVGEWPWIAALFNAGRQFCGGSLIDSTHILSAAHCVAHMSSWDVARLTVRLGDHNIRTNSEVRHVEKKVKRVVRHRGFDSRTLYNDIAILTLDSPVQFSQQIRPVCLPAAASDHTGRTATVIGWGSLRESGPQPAVLQEVNIPIWSNSDCRNKYGPAAPGGIVEHMLCAGQASRDSCSGDSGGPLMINSGRWTQVGIVSWGIGCGKGQYPGVYTRVEKFLPWIYKNLK